MILLIIQSIKWANLSDTIDRRNVILEVQGPSGPINFQFAAFRASLISSFAPFGRSGHVTHATMLVFIVLHFIVLFIFPLLVVIILVVFLSLSISSLLLLLSFSSFSSVLVQSTLLLLSENLTRAAAHQIGVCSPQTEDKSILGVGLFSSFPLNKTFHVAINGQFCSKFVGNIRTFIFDSLVHFTIIEVKGSPIQNSAPPIWALPEYKVQCSEIQFSEQTGLSGYNLQ